MHVLMVDDDPMRQELFEVVYERHTVVRATTYDQAMAALDTARFDQVFLDNDMREGSDRSGETVAHAIAAMPPARRPGRVIIHTGDLLAAERMLDILTQAGVPASRLNERPVLYGWCQGP